MSEPDKYYIENQRLLTELKAERDRWKNETQRCWRKLNRLRAEKDDDGTCLRCGLGWDDEKDSNDDHLCPPGFWNDGEKQIVQLKAEIAARDKQITLLLATNDKWNDALVWALAGWERSEFEREHKGCRKIMGAVVLQEFCNDPRHTWTAEQWQQAARGKLEAGK